MGQFSDAFKEAGEDFDAEFADKLVKSDFSSEALLKMTPDGGPNRDAMLEFIKEAKKAASAEEAKAAFLNLSGKVGTLLAKGAIKAIKGGLGALLAILFIAAPAHAQNDSMAQIGEWIKSLSFGAGVAAFPNASEPRTEAIAYWRGPQYGQKGLSLIPDKAKPEAKPYIDFNLGGRWKKGEPVKAFPMVLFHPGNLMEPLGKKISSRWRLPVFPENFVAGPTVRIPLPGDPEPWTPRTGIRFIVGWEF